MNLITIFQKNKFKLGKYYKDFSKYLNDELSSGSYSNK